MALKPGRFELVTDPSYFMNEVASQGVFVVFGNMSGSITGPSGEGLDDTKSLVNLASSPSGLVPAGCLLTEVVNIDTTKFHTNFHKEQVNITNKVTVLRKGWVVTDKVSGTPKLGDKAYLTTSGSVTPTVSSTGGTVATPLVGQFLGAKDEDGYVKVEVNLP